MGKFLENVTVKQEEAYFNHLINETFKILPLKEEAIRDKSNKNLISYLKGFRAELMGFTFLFEISKQDPIVFSLFSKIEFLINEEYDKRLCKKEVFDCIDIIERIRDKYVYGLF